MQAQGVYTVQSNRMIAKDVFIMRLSGDTSAFAAPGQFVNIQLGGFFLRRPISVCRWDADGFDIIFKVLGDGTAQMSLYGPGTELDIMVGLGNGFDPAAARGKKSVLVGGGVGVPPLYSLAKALVAGGDAPLVALGFADRQDAFFVEEFEALGLETRVATDNGTLGQKGFVTGLLQEMDYEYYFACGPNAMLQSVFAVGEAKGAAGQLSFEERMGCGFGACMGCSHKTKNGSKRVCAEGPVFLSEEVVFE